MNTIPLCLLTGLVAAVLAAGCSDEPASLEIPALFGVQGIDAGLSPGSTCSVDAECADGPCAGGHCCAGPCAVDYTCDSSCSARFDGQCDAQGACHESVQHLNSQCAMCGEDGYPSVGPMSCTPGCSYICDPHEGIGCFNAPGDKGVCGGGHCVITLQANGASCMTPNGCQSGFCVEGICCDSACTDQCQTCRAGQGASADGVCGPSTGTWCGGGAPCEQHHSCQAGVCMPGGPVICAADDECHEAGTCDPNTYLCSSPAKADGTSCSLGTCQQGVCTPPDGGLGTGGAGAGTGGAGSGAGGASTGAGTSTGTSTGTGATSTSTGASTGTSSSTGTGTGGGAKFNVADGCSVSAAGETDGGRRRDLHALAVAAVALLVGSRRRARAARRGERGFGAP